MKHPWEIVGCYGRPLYQPRLGDSFSPPETGGYSWARAYFLELGAFLGLLDEQLRNGNPELFHELMDSVFSDLDGWGGLRGKTGPDFEAALTCIRSVGGGLIRAARAAGFFPTADEHRADRWRPQLGLDPASSVSELLVEFVRAGDMGLSARAEAKTARKRSETASWLLDHAQLDRHFIELEAPAHLRAGGYPFWIPAPAYALAALVEAVFPAFDSGCSEAGSSAPRALFDAVAELQFRSRSRAAIQASGPSEVTITNGNRAAIARIDGDGAPIAARAYRSKHVLALLLRVFDLGRICRLREGGTLPHMIPNASPTAIRLADSPDRSIVLKKSELALLIAPSAGNSRSTQNDVIAFARAVSKTTLRPNTHCSIDMGHLFKISKLGRGAWLFSLGPLAVRYREYRERYAPDLPAALVSLIKPPSVPFDALGDRTNPNTEALLASVAVQLQVLFRMRASRDRASGRYVLDADPILAEILARMPLDPERWPHEYIGELLCPSTETGETCWARVGDSWAFSSAHQDQDRFLDEARAARRRNSPAGRRS